MSQYIEITDQKMFSDERSLDGAEVAEERLEPTDTTIFEVTVKAVCECVRLKNVRLLIDQPKLGAANGTITIAPADGQTIAKLDPGESQQVRFTVTTKAVKPSGSYPQTIKVTFDTEPLVEVVNEFALQVEVSPD